MKLHSTKAKLNAAGQTANADADAVEAVVLINVRFWG
jgi:hypothetical protein